MVNTQFKEKLMMKNYDDLINVCKIHCKMLDVMEESEIPISMYLKFKEVNDKGVDDWVKENGFTEGEFTLALHALGLVDCSAEWATKRD